MQMLIYLFALCDDPDSPYGPLELEPSAMVFHYAQEVFEGLKAYTTGEQSYSVWAAPTWPVKFCLFFGLLLLAIQSVSEILKQVRGIIEDVTAKKLPEDGKEAQK